LLKNNGFGEGLFAMSFWLMQTLLPPATATASTRFTGLPFFFFFYLYFYSSFSYSFFFPFFFFIFLFSLSFLKAFIKDRTGVNLIFLSFCYVGNL